MTRKRDHIPLPEQLAAALAPSLSDEVRKALSDARASAADVVRAFQLDHHPILHADGGEDKWWNLQWMLIAAHREKSRRDTSIVAKTKRLNRSQEEFRARMLKPDKGKSEARDSRWPKRKLQSRNSFERRGT